MAERCDFIHLDWQGDAAGTSALRKPDPSPTEEQSLTLAASLLSREPAALGSESQVHVIMGPHAQGEADVTRGSPLESSE